LCLTYPTLVNFYTTHCTANNFTACKFNMDQTHQSHRNKAVAYLMDGY
jgi:hypothetical protein